MPEISRKMTKTTHSWFGWIVLALCLLSFVRGLYQIGDQSLWWDESLSLHRAVRPFSFIFSNRILFLYGTEETPITPDHHPPLYFALLRLIVLSAGDSEFALRYLSLVACVLVVPLLYQCGRYLYDGATGVCAALLSACSPLYLWAQQEARPYALATLFAVTAFCALLFALGERPSDQGTSSRPGHQKRWAALFFVSSAAMVITHYHTLQLLPAYALIYLLARGGHKGRMLWALLVVGAVGGGVALYGLREIMPKYAIEGYSFIPLGTLLQDLMRAFPLGVSGTRLVLYQWVAGGLLLFALSVLFFRLRGSSRRYATYLLLCLALPVAEIYAVSFVRPVYMNIRHVMFASPFYYLLLAAGAVQVRHIRLGRWARTLIGGAVGFAMAMLLVGMGLSTYTYFADPRYDKEDHRGWGEYISEHVRPDDVVFVYPGAVYELYNYYVSSPAPYYGIPLPGADTKRTVDTLVEIGQKYDRVWIAHSLTPGWAYVGNDILGWLEENALRVSSAAFRGHLNTFPVYAYRLEPPIYGSLLEEATALNLDFGGQLHLLGVQSVNEQVQAGSPLLLSLYWSATKPLDQEYQFTLSLDDAKGNSWSFLDYAPYEGTYPVTRWPVDQIVRVDIDLDVPVGTPPGRYLLNASVYPADLDSPALAVRELGSDRLKGLIVPIAEIDVARAETPPHENEISVAHRIRRRYGALALLGYNYREGTYRPGDVLYLDLYWRAVRAPGQDTTLTLQLSDATGDVLATRPISPVAGYPTSLWQEGELLCGKQRFRVPIDVPEGEYTLWLVPDGDSPLNSIAPWATRVVRLGTLAVRPSNDQYALEIPPIQHKVGTVLDDRVELLGYDLEDSAIRAGEVVSCTLYWRGLQGMDQDYTVFTHLVAPDGSVWGQWDNQPQQGMSPTTRWVPGQVVADPYRIPLSEATPPGTLVLHVGMYNQLTMERLPVLDEDGQVVGDSVAVADIEIVSAE